MICPHITNSREEKLLKTDNNLTFYFAGFIRNNAECQKEFVGKKGLSMVLEAMKEHGKIRTKASFLLISLMRDYPKYKGDIYCIIFNFRK